MTKGGTTQRGYGWAHQQARKRWKARVDAGHVTCWRCGHGIQPGTPWDLGHDDHDRTRYRGPEHLTCNRRAGQAVAQQRMRARKRKPLAINSRRW
jgi:hypothetical protein